MNCDFYTKLTQAGLNVSLLDSNIYLDILTSPDINLLRLLDAAYQVRKHFVGNDVTIHIINNAQNGFCPEDCHYCAQAKISDTPIETYSMKSDDEILAEAKDAYESGAFRYCLVYAGRGPSEKRVQQLASIIRKIKETYPLQVCVSPGLLDEQGARVLKDAGLDRLNHNLNTSRDNYANICTTHSFEDRLSTLQAAKSCGLDVCSGLIAGMGETAEGLIEMALKLRSFDAASIPVNFLIPIPGTALKKRSPLTPEYCLRILSLFRLTNPKAEIRMAAGRETHLRQMEVLGLYPANSLFMDGYLNTRGNSRLRTLQMIRDAGFTIRSEQNLDDLIRSEEEPSQDTDSSETVLKTLADLRPTLSAH